MMIHILCKLINDDIVHRIPISPIYIYTHIIHMRTPLKPTGFDFLFCFTMFFWFLCQKKHTQKWLGPNPASVSRSETLTSSSSCASWVVVSSFHGHITIFNGKTHYKYLWMAIFNGYVQVTEVWCWWILWCGWCLCVFVDVDDDLRCLTCHLM